ncbi:MAG TPA: heme-binding protein [Sphingomicrobium sp.]|nr:heme-binding protein [Sphingomicrobium sp.]
MRLLLLSTIFLASAAPLQAQTASTLNAQAAQAIVAGCAAHSTTKKQSHAVVVVDSGGHLVAALRMDGNASGILDFSLAKAEAAAAWGFSTAQMLEASRGTPGFDRAPKVVIVPGGVPVFSADGKSRIGAVGVSGEAPADDAACAEAGIAAAGLRSSRAN